MAGASCSYKPVGIFWDIENCPVPKQKSAGAIIAHIRSHFVSNRLNHREFEFLIACDIIQLRKDIPEDVNRAGGVTLAHVSGASKNAADEKIRESMKKFVDTHIAVVAPILILISGDIDFINDLRGFQMRLGCHIILIHAPQCSDQFKIGWNELYSFDKLFATLPAKALAPEEGAKTPKKQQQQPEKPEESNAKANSVSDQDARQNQAQAPVNPVQIATKNGEKEVPAWLQQYLMNTKPPNQLQNSNPNPACDSKQRENSDASSHSGVVSSDESNGEGKKKKRTRTKKKSQQHQQASNALPGLTVVEAKTNGQILTFWNSVTAAAAALPPPAPPLPTPGKPGKPNLVLVVMGLPGKMEHNVLRSALQEHAHKFWGKVKFVNNGQGYIGFETKEDADRAIKHFRSIKLYEKKLIVNYATKLPFLTKKGVPTPVSAPAASVFSSASGQPQETQGGGGNPASCLQQQQIGLGGVVGVEPAPISAPGQPKLPNFILVVMGLPGTMEHKVLRNALQEHATKVGGSVKFVKNGQGYIGFETKEDAERAIILFRRIKLYDKVLKASYATKIPFENNRGSTSTPKDASGQVKKPPPLMSLEDLVIAKASDSQPRAGAFGAIGQEQPPVVKPYPVLEAAASNSGATTASLRIRIESGNETNDVGEESQEKAHTKLANFDVGTVATGSSQLAAPSGPVPASISVPGQAKLPNFILVVMGLPGKAEHPVLRKALQEHATKVGGKVKFVKNGQGYIGFNTKENAQRGLTLFDGLEIFEKKLNARYTMRIPFDMKDGAAPTPGKAQVLPPTSPADFVKAEAANLPPTDIVVACAEPQPNANSGDVAANSGAGSGTAEEAENTSDGRTEPQLQQPQDLLISPPYVGTGTIAGAMIREITARRTGSGGQGGAPVVNGQESCPIQ